MSQITDGPTRAWLLGEVTSLAEQVAELTDERDRARRIAVALEQECAAQDAAIADMLNAFYDLSSGSTGDNGHWTYVRSGDLQQIRDAAFALEEVR